MREVKPKLWRDGFEAGVEAAAQIAETHDWRGDTAKGIRKLLESRYYEKG